MTAVPDSSVPRLVVVDDTDPTIQYSPASAFSLDSSGKLDWTGYGGPVFNQTITGTSINGTINYTFNGTFVRAVLAAEGGDSNWVCMVDGHVIQGFSVYDDQITNLIGCDSADSLQGTTTEHTLNVQLYPNDTVPATLYLDSIQYQPQLSDPLDSVILRIHNSDPSVTYGNSSGGWSYQGYNSNATDITGTSVNFAFNGTSVSLYSVNFGDPDQYNASSAFYTMDENSSVTFPLPASLNVSTTGTYANIMNWPLFTIPDLSELSHDLKVVTSYNVTGPDYPQWLDIQYFLVKTNPANSSSLRNATNSAPDSTASSVTTHRNVGAIVGGVLGGLIGLAALVLLFLFLRRRSRNPYSGMMLDLNEDPGFYRSNTGDTLEVTPFITAAAPPGISIPMKYVDNPIPHNGSSSSTSASAPGDSPTSQTTQRSAGWNANRFVTPMSSKNQRMMQAQEEQLRRSEIRQHMDSGVRLPSAAEAEVVDVPPTYTEE